MGLKICDHGGVAIGGQFSPPLESQGERRPSLRPRRNDEVFD
jgi:hypothetical protein